MVFGGAYIRYYAHLRILRTPTTHHHIFHTNCKNTPPTSAQGQFLVRRAVDVVVGRRLKKRSLLYVNEHFSVKPNAADAPLSQEIIGESPYKPYHLDAPLPQF